ncbi:hypothetical protein E2C01_013687 [Portunus trituberculatus]|uniref:Uncharacterized protein n=1 Tax=Portunus trituberculatus TaxID=210409 RepID=A0A5B7DGX5_PORTR|nr:hypothetical protein [Portunus trituberculatus]
MNVKEQRKERWKETEERNEDSSTISRKGSKFTPKSPKPNSEEVNKEEQRKKRWKEEKEEEQRKKRWKEENEEEQRKK